MKIREEILTKVGKGKNGKEVVNKLTELAGRTPTDAYNRGILHGFLLALSLKGIIDNEDALDILCEYREEM